MNDERYATVTFYRASKNICVAVKMVATVKAKTDEEAIEKAMAEIKGIFPVDTLWPEDKWGWYWDDENEAEVHWEDG
jgi:hypothetical protein